jgi:hypothetical protein
MNNVMKIGGTTYLNGIPFKNPKGKVIVKSGLF